MRDLSKDASLLSLNTATVRKQWKLAEIIDGCVRHGFGGIGPWRDQVAELGLKESARRIRDAGLIVTGLCRGGMFTAADENGRKAAIENNLLAIDEAVELGAQCLVMVCGGLPPGSKDLEGARVQVFNGLSAILERARAAQIPIAIEPLHPMYAADRSVVNTLGQALDMCDLLGDGVGVVVDVYHVWWDPALASQIARAGRDNRILAFHVSDWLVPTRDLLLDRGMMGDGVIDLRGIRGMVEAAGYDGLIEVEIFSEEWWAKSGDEVLELCTEVLSGVP